VSTPDRAEDHAFRSRFIHTLLRKQLESTGDAERHGSIPCRLLQFWDDASNIPADVGRCMASWTALRSEGFELRRFDDQSARAFIARHYGSDEARAFERCHHPAMRCDYFRLCYIGRMGGFYVDADDVFTGNGWRDLVADNRLKLQPMCYDVLSGTMVPPEEFWSDSAARPERIYYVNNSPLIAPAGHPVIARALTRATRLLLGMSARRDIQATTGPGNLSACLVAHLLEDCAAGASSFCFIKDWERIATTVWDLSYRNDARNWRLHDIADGPTD